MFDHPGTFWRYVWNTNRLIYFNLIVNTLFLIFGVITGSVFAIVSFSIFLLASVILAHWSYRLWLERIDIHNGWKEIIAHDEANL